MRTELVFELERAEAELSRALLELRADLGRRIEALRRARRATRGYEPGASSTPAFVSRSV